MADLKKEDKKYIANTYTRFDLELTKGKGSVLSDELNRSYIDMGAGIAVNTFGANDELWKQAVIEQMNMLSHTSNLYYTSPQVKLAKLLCMKTGMKKVFFCNSGAEANECAIKTARKYSSDKYGAGRHTIVTLYNSFHGRTVTTLSATGQDVFHKDFGPFTEGFVYAKPDDYEDMKNLLETNSCCAVMIELIQGEGGVYVLDKDYVNKVVNLAHEKDLLVIIDEVQTGNGRTGELYCYKRYGIEPDIVTTAKGLGGGLPIGAAMFNAKTENVLGYGSHGSTFGGNPIICAGAYSIIKRIDRRLLNSVLKKEELIRDLLKDSKGIISISGMGLMLGVETVRPAKDVVNDCMKNGVMFLTAKNKVRMLPPLNISRKNIRKAISVLKEAAVK
jgi:acetylornithine/N-succinyldiaminopimelate aminotransferase